MAGAFCLRTWLLLSRAPAIALFALVCAAIPSWSQATPDVAALLRQSADGQAANGVALLHHSWTQSTEIVLDGESKGTMYHLVRFDLDGRIQRTTLGVEEEGRLRLMPLDRGRRIAVTAIRGLAGAIVDSRVGAIQQTVAAVGGLAAGYGIPGAAFYESASYAAGSGELAQTVKASGEGVLKPGDALTADVGETVRLFVGNGGPSLISSFHVIGEIFDRVHLEAGTAVTENVQTTLVPAGGAAIVEFETPVPGNFLIVDHAIFRAFNKGALGMLAVAGDGDSLVYSGRIQAGVYVPEGGAVQTIPADAPDERAENDAERVVFGERVFTQNCVACHQAGGEGLANAFPPLAGADYLNADRNRAIAVVVNGLDGPITVNGQGFDGVMPALRLTDEDVANVLTYVYSAWGNAGFVVQPDEVAAIRARQ